MARSDHITVMGKVIKEERTYYLVELENGHQVKCTLKGNVRRNFIRVLADDKVEVELSPYSVDKGWISYRYK